MKRENYTHHHYFISSRDKLNFESKNNKFTVKSPNFQNVHSFSIKSILIPHTFYNINSTNNTLTIRKHLDTADRTLTLDIGDYSIVEMITLLKQELDGLAGPVQTYTVTRDDKTAKLTITQNLSTFIMRGSSSMMELLGFERGIDTSNSQNHNSDFIFDLSYTKNISIKSTALTIFDTRIKSSSDQDSNLLIQIPVHDSQFGNNIVAQYHQINYSIDDTKERDIDISLYDQDDNLLGGNTGLNNRDVIIHLVYITKQSNDHRLHNRYDARSHQNSGRGNVLN